MCDCNSIKIVDLPHLKIYLSMAKYEVKKEWLGKGLGSKFSDSTGRTVKIGWDNATQEELAYVYEEFNSGDTFINKINKSSEKTDSKAKKPNKDEAKGGE